MASSGRGGGGGAQQYNHYGSTLQTMSIPAIIMAFGRPSGREQTVQVDPDEELEEDLQSQAFGAGSSTGQQIVAAGGGANPWTAQSRPPAPPPQGGDAQNRPVYFQLCFAVKNFSQEELAGNSLSSVHARLCLLNLNAHRWAHPEMLTVRFERLLAVNREAPGQLQIDMRLIYNKIDLSAVEVCTIDDAHVSSDVQAYMEHHFSETRFHRQNVGFRVYIDIHVDCSPHKVLNRYIDRLAAFARDPRLFRANRSNETVFMEGIQNVHRISSRKAYVAQIRELSYLPDSILNACDYNVDALTVVGSEDDLNVSDGVGPQSIFFPARTIGHTEDILAHHLASGKLSILSTQLDENNYGAATSCSDLPMGLFVRVSGDPISADIGADEDDAEDSDREGSGAGRFASKRVFLRADDLAAARMPAFDDTPGHSRILHGFEGNTYNFVKVDPLQLDWLPALSTVWPTQLGEFFMKLGIVVGMNPTIYYLPAETGSRTERSPRVGAARASLLNPHEEDVAPEQQNSVRVHRVQPQDELQRLGDLIEAHFRWFFDRNGNSLTDLEIAAVNNVRRNGFFFRLWFPTMRVFHSSHGACHTEILSFGRSVGLHDTDVKKILSDTVRPPLATAGKQSMSPLGGAGAAAGTEEVYQGVVAPLMAQMAHLLVHDYAGLVFKSLNCHQLMTMILLPAVYQANWPLRSDQPKNANNFLAMGPYSCGKTWIYEIIQEMLAIPATIRNVGRLTRAGMDGGDSNGFVWVMDEMSEEQLSAGRDPIVERLKMALTSKKSGVQETSMQDKHGNHGRHSVFTENQNPGGVFGASNTDPRKVCPALLSRFLPSYPTQQERRLDGVAVQNVSQLTNSEDTLSPWRAFLRDRFFTRVQYCVAMMTSMVSCGVLAGNFEIAFRTVKEVAKMMANEWGVKLETRHEAMIFKLIRVYTCMKAVIMGLFYPAVQSRVISDDELASARSLEEVLFTIGQRSLVAGQDTAYAAIGAFVPFIYEMDVDIVVCYLLSQLEGFTATNQNLNSKEMDAVFMSYSNYPISSMGDIAEPVNQVADEPTAAFQADADFTRFPRNFNYLMLAVDLPELSDFLVHRLKITEHQADRYLQILMTRSYEFFVRKKPYKPTNMPLMGAVDSGPLLVVKPTSVPSGPSERLDSAKKVKRVWLNVQYAQSKLKTLIEKERRDQNVAAGAAFVVRLRPVLKDYAVSSIALSEWTNMIDRTVQKDFPQMNIYTGFTIPGCPDVVHQHTTPVPTGPSFTVSTRFIGTPHDLQRMRLPVSSAYPASAPSDGEHDGCGRVAKRSSVCEERPLARSFRYPHAFCWWNAMVDNGVYPWVTDKEGREALVIGLGHVSFECLAVDYGDVLQGWCVDSCSNFPLDFLPTSVKQAYLESRPQLAAADGCLQHKPLYRVAIRNPAGGYIFWGEAQSAKTEV